jgi:hypothetical protein
LAPGAGELRLLSKEPIEHDPNGGSSDGSCTLLHPKYKLPAHCFGYVGSALKPQTWKLPCLLADGTVDLKRLPKAVQSILSNYRGTRVQGIPEEAIAAVLTRLALAARRFREDLQKRLAKFGLELHPDKTRRIEFGRYAELNRKRRGEGKPETFDFLGFTHISGKNRKGYFTVKRRTIARRRPGEAAGDQAATSAASARTGRRNGGVARYPYRDRYPLSAHLQNVPRDLAVSNAARRRCRRVVRGTMARWVGSAFHFGLLDFSISDVGAVSTTACPLISTDKLGVSRSPVVVAHCAHFAR